MTEETAVYMAAPQTNGEAPLPKRAAPKGLMPPTRLQGTLKIEYHRQQAERRRATLTDLLHRHEAAGEPLAGGAEGGGR